MNLYSVLLFTLLADKALRVQCSIRGQTSQLERGLYDDDIRKHKGPSPPAPGDGHQHIDVPIPQPILAPTTSPTPGKHNIAVPLPNLLTPHLFEQEHHNTPHPSVPRNTPHPSLSPQSHGIFPEIDQELGKTEPEPDSPLDPACQAIANNEIYQTRNFITVSYYYELLAKKTVLLNTATNFVDISVQNLLVDSLVDCNDNSQHPRPIQGVSPSDNDKYAGGQCSEITSYNESSEICYVVEGSTLVYLLESSSITKNEVTNLVYDILRKEFNDSERRRMEKFSLLNEETGLLRLHFLGDYSMAFGTSSQLNSAKIVGSPRKADRNRIRPGVGAGILGAAFFVFVILGFAIVKQLGSGDQEQETYKQGHSVDENYTLSMSKAGSLESPTFTSDGEEADHHGHVPVSADDSYDDVSKSCTFRIEKILGAGEQYDRQPDDSTTNSHTYTYNSRYQRDGDDDSLRSYAYSTAGVTLVSSNSDTYRQGSLASVSTAPSLKVYKDRRSVIRDRQMSRRTSEAVEFAESTSDTVSL